MKITKSKVINNVVMFVLGIVLMVTLVYGYHLIKSSYIHIDSQYQAVASVSDSSGNRVYQNDNNTAANVAQDAVSSVTLMVTTLGILMTAITILATVISIVSANKLAEIDSKLSDINTIKSMVEDSEKQGQYFNGVNYRQKGKYKSALHIFNSIENKVNPENHTLKFHILFERALIHIDEVYTDEARTNDEKLKCFNNAIKDFEKAEEEIRRISAENINTLKNDFYHDFGGAYGLLGKHYYKNGKEKDSTENFEKSIKTFQKALNISHDDLCYKNIAITYFLMKDNDNGIKALKKYMIHAREYTKLDDLKKNFFEPDEIQIIGNDAIDNIYKEIEQFWSSV